VFRMAGLGVGKTLPGATLAVPTRPDRDDTPGAGLALEQINGVDRQRSVEQQLDVVDQHKVAARMLVDDLAQEAAGLQLALR